MFSHALKTARVTDIPLGVEEGTVAGLARSVAAPDGRGWAKLLGSFTNKAAVPDSSLLIVSLALQLRSQCGTITFPSKQAKKKALRRYPKSTAWNIDDVFSGLTVLHSLADPQLDICAVHGMNGNAFDTWAYDHETNWLRDFLPQDERLREARVMTYGYSSLLQDNNNLSSLTEWSRGLLFELSSLRRSQAVCPS
ncbi:hypothetical protein GQ53DRAFT_465131 [Thozetella sp. PMI_491]|nr:hypothetical protein GQ53DRAFT_465131 [Thozetella sp. PMI_491]